MSALQARFASLAGQGEGALILFVTAGEPKLEDLPDILTALEEGGADIIEIGLPFSDPIADGPTIQASNQRALDRGVSPRKVLDKLQTVTLGVPLVLMGYYNSALRPGLDRFAADLHQSGFSGTILSDLTPEESDGWIRASQAYGLDNIFLAAPTSTDSRLEMVCARSTGFVYAVSRTGVTGENPAGSSEAQELVRRIKSHTSLPVCVGFGIRSPGQVRSVCETADGAVVGSWLVDLIECQWGEGKGRDRIIRAVSELKAATRRGT